MMEDATAQAKKPTEGDAIVAAGDSDESKEDKVHKVELSETAT